MKITDDGTPYPFAMWQTDNGAKLNVISISEETAEAIEDLRESVNKLHYVLNHIGLLDCFDRTQVRNRIDEIQIKFNHYIQTLNK